MDLTLILVFAAVLTVPDKPLTPAWSPNHEYLATTEVPMQFVTPEGGNYKLLINGKLVYPTKVRHGLFSAYTDQHTFLSNLAWSPDNAHIAFVQKIYDWEYLDPYNRYWDGRVSKLRYYLTIVSPNGEAGGYPLAEVPETNTVEWLGPNRLDYKGQTYDLLTNPPLPIK